MSAADDIQKLTKNQVALQKNFTYLKKQVADMSAKIRTLESAAGSGIVPDQEQEEENTQQSADNIDVSSSQAETSKPIENLGFKIFGAIGFFLILLGLFYLYRFAVDAGYISVLGRIVLGVVFSVLVVAVGEYFYRKDYAQYGMLLTGGGLGLLYFTFFATYFFESYRSALGMTLTLNAILLTFVMLITVLLALKNDSIILACYGFFLGYLSAFLAFTQGSANLCMWYTLLLSIAFAIVIAKKNWPLGPAPVVISYILYSVYFSDVWPRSYTFNKAAVVPVDALFGFLLAFFVLYIVQVFFLKDGKENIQNIAITLINAFAFLGFGLLIVLRYANTYRGVFLIALAALFLLLAAVAKRRELHNVYETFFLICITFLTLTFPVQLDGAWITLAWAIEGFLLVLGGVRVQHKGLRMLGYVVIGIAAIRTLLYDLWVLDFGWRTLSALVVICALYLSARLISAVEKSEARYNFQVFFGITAVFFATLLLAVELLDSRGILSILSSNARLVLLSVVWAIEAIALTALGFVNKVKSIRTIGLILFCITLGKVLLIDLASLNDISRTFVTILVGIVALVGAFVYVKNKEKLKEVLEE